MPNDMLYILFPTGSCLRAHELQSRSWVKWSSAHDDLVFSFLSCDYKYLATVAKALVGHTSYSHSEPSKKLKKFHCCSCHPKFKKRGAHDLFWEAHDIFMWFKFKQAIYQLDFMFLGQTKSCVMVDAGLKHKKIITCICHKNLIMWESQ